MAIESFWPYGKPREGSYTLDRQGLEDSALRLKWLAENKLTPTKRLKKSVNPVRYVEIVNEALEKFTRLKEQFPEYSKNYDCWIQECTYLLTIVKPKSV